MSEQTVVSMNELEYGHEAKIFELHMKMVSSFYR